MSKISVLYLSYTGMTDPLGQSQVLAYILGLTRLDKYAFTIISLENPKNFQVEKDQVQALCDASGIKWIPLMYHSTPRILGSFKDIRNIKLTIKKLQAESPFQIVHCRSYRGSLVGHWMKKKFGTRFIFDMRGFWADERVEGNIWDMKKPVYRLIYNYFKKKERVLLRDADQTICLTNNARNVIQNWKLPFKIAPIAVIPCCVDLDLFKKNGVNQIQERELRLKYDLPDDAYIISYLGSLGTWYELDEMLAFFSHWLKQNPQALFLFITKEPQQMIHEAARKAGVGADRLRIFSVPRAQVPALLALSNCGLFFYKQTFSRKACSPVKLGELMSMGIPVICNAGVGDTTGIVEKYNAGIVVDTYDQTKYPLVIRSFLSCQFDRGLIRKGAEKEFALQEGVLAYDEVYQNITK